MASKKAHKFLTLTEKSKILNRLDEGVCPKRLALDYKVNKSTISRILKNKNRILEDFAKTFRGPGNRKYLKQSGNPAMEEKLQHWFLKQRERNVPINGKILQEKAKTLHQEINPQKNFCASEGWLSKFKKRHGIRILSISGEKLSSQPELVAPFLSKFRQKILELNLSHNQIYNADESGLYWKTIPDKTFVAAHERSAPGRKVAKDRLTFLVCANATGSHKISPLVIGKSKRPRCFKDWIIPLPYKSSKNAWMTAYIFKDWFHNIFVPEVRTYCMHLYMCKTFQIELVTLDTTN